MVRFNRQLDNLAVSRNADCKSQFDCLERTLQSFEREASRFRRLESAGLKYSDAISTFTSRRRTYNRTAFRTASMHDTCARWANEKLTNIVAATNLAVEMPTGTETGIRHDAFLKRSGTETGIRHDAFLKRSGTETGIRYDAFLKRYVYLTSTSSTFRSRYNPAGEHSLGGCCSPAQRRTTSC